MPRIVCLLFSLSALWITGCSDTYPTQTLPQSTELQLESGRSVRVNALAPGRVAVQWREIDGSLINGTFHQQVASAPRSEATSLSRSLETEDGRRWRTAYRLDPTHHRYAFLVEVPGRIESVAMEFGENGARYRLSTITPAGTDHAVINFDDPGDIAVDSNQRGLLIQRLRTLTSPEFAATYPELTLMEELAEHPGLREVLAALEDRVGVMATAGGLSDDAARRLCGLNNAIQKTICRKDIKGPGLMRVVCQLSDLIELMFCSGLDTLFLYEFSRKIPSILGVLPAIPTLRETEIPDSGFQGPGALSGRSQPQGTLPILQGKRIL